MTILIFPFFHKRVWFMLIPYKIKDTLDKTNLFSQWNLFNGNKNYYYTVLIEAKTNKKTYLWNIRADRKIGDFVLNSNHHRLTLAHFYPITGNLLFNEYFFENIKKHLKNKNEELLSYNMKLVKFDSQSRIRLRDDQKKEPLFSWNKQK